MPSAFIQNFLFDRQMFNTIISASAQPEKYFFTSEILNIFPRNLLISLPCDHRFPNVKPNIFDPYAFFQHARRSIVKLKKDQGCGVWGKYSYILKNAVPLILWGFIFFIVSEIWQCQKLRLVALTHSS